MKLQTIFIKNLLLIGFWFHVQSIPAFQKHNFIIDLSNNTNKFSLPTNSSTCIFDHDCQKNSWCNASKCQCKKGWLMFNNNPNCSYKQKTKSSILILSLFVGAAGIDWFVLSCKNNLYILIGLLKFLISTAGCIWTRLSFINRTKTSAIVAGGLGVSLGFISIIWWIIDWIRIISNHFPDGNGVSLI